MQVIWIVPSFSCSAAVRDWSACRIKFPASSFAFKNLLNTSLLCGRKKNTFLIIKNIFLNELFCSKSYLIEQFTKIYIKNYNILTITLRQTNTVLKRNVDAATLHEITVHSYHGYLPRSKSTIKVAQMMCVLYSIFCEAYHQITWNIRTSPLVIWTTSTVFLLLFIQTWQH